MKAMAGIKMSYRLQNILQCGSGGIVRGFRSDEVPVALNHYIYSLIRNSRNYRRAVLSCTLNMFDDTAVSCRINIKGSRTLIQQIHNVGVQVQNL